MNQGIKGTEILLKSIQFVNETESISKKIIIQTLGENNLPEIANFLKQKITKIIFC